MNVKFNRLASSNKHLDQFWTGSKQIRVFILGTFSKQKEQLYVIQFEWYLRA